MIFTTGTQTLSALSASDFQTLRTKLHDGLWTGILEAEFPSGDDVVFLCCGGTLKGAYRLVSKTAQKKDVETEWSSLAEAQPASAVSLTVSAAALRLIKIMLEHPAPAETLLVKSSRLDRIFDQWLQQLHPNLVVLKWMERQGLVMLWPGLPVPPSVFLVSSDGAREDAETYRQIFSLDPNECEASRHAFLSDGSAWEEYSFQHMFARLLEAMLVRYKDLTGLALLNALDRNINRIAFENKWDFSITLGAITDRMLFCDLDELLAACKTLLGVASEHIGVVLGQKLSRSLVQDAISSLDVHSIHLVEKYSIDALLGAPRVAMNARERADA